jgi:hypothetical protein
MAAPKRKQQRLAVVFQVVQSLGQGGWFLAWTILLSAATALGGVWLWQKYGDSIVSDPGYRLTAERLHVPPQPVWIRRADVKAEAILRGRLQGADIRDPDIAPRIYRAFLNSPWVKDVLLVNKSSARTAGINVRLTYRKPVAMVIVEAKKFADVDFELGLYPVDIDGHVLPPEFTLEDANAYPKIGNVRTHPVGSFGETWGDPRVSAAAKIVELLSEVWAELQLYRVDVPDLEVVSSGAPYLLIRMNGESIVWGSAPGEERPGEENAGEKIVRLRESHKTDRPGRAASKRLITPSVRPANR